MTCDPAYGDLARRAAGALRRRLTTPLHGGGCACCGAGMVRLSPEMLEDDILGFLAGRYRDSGEEALHRLVEDRLSSADGSLSRWLERVAADETIGAARGRLLEDVLDVVGVERAQGAAGPPRIGSWR